MVKPARTRPNLNIRWLTVSAVLWITLALSVDCRLNAPPKQHTTVGKQSKSFPARSGGKTHPRSARFSPVSTWQPDAGSPQQPFFRLTIQLLSGPSHRLQRLFINAFSRLAHHTQLFFVAHPKTQETAQNDAHRKTQHPRPSRVIRTSTTRWAMAAHARFCHLGQDCTIDFPYNDDVLLEDGQTHGGRVWVPAAARAQTGRFPLIVLLHGIECGKNSRLHRLLPTTQNLAAITKQLIRNDAIDPVVLAAPSQTERAGYSGTLWPKNSFDLVEFVLTVEKVLKSQGLHVSVARRDISVFGHSGAGCGSGKNGLYRIARQRRKLHAHGIRIKVLGLMDVCFGGRDSARLLTHALRKTETKVFGMWVEPEIWGDTNYRFVPEFTRTLGADRKVDCDRKRYASCVVNRRGWRMYEANREHLLSLYFNDRAKRDQLTPHSALPLWFMEEALLLYFKDTAN
jgi:hypothetical protein